MLELTTFRAAPGVDDAQLLAADERVRTGFLYQQPGLVRATTARGDDGGWAVLVLWRSAGDADSAGVAAGEHPATLALLGLVDGPTLEVRRYTPC